MHAQELITSLWFRWLSWLRETAKLLAVFLSSSSIRIWNPRFSWDHMSPNQLSPRGRTIMRTYRSTRLFRPPTESRVLLVVVLNATAVTGVWAVSQRMNIDTGNKIDRKCPRCCSCMNLTCANGNCCSWWRSVQAAAGYRYLMNASVWTVTAWKRSARPSSSTVWLPLRWYSCDKTPSITWTSSHQPEEVALCVGRLVAKIENILLSVRYNSSSSSSSIVGRNSGCTDKHLSNQHRCD